MPRINGRVIRPATLAERRLLLSLGTPALRVPRGTNPYVVARRLGRAARGESPDLLFVQDVAAGRNRPRPPRPRPQPDNLEPKKNGSAPVNHAESGRPA
jgi:hypothetical protein